MITEQKHEYILDATTLKWATIYSWLGGNDIPTQIMSICNLYVYIYKILMIYKFN